MNYKYYPTPFSKEGCDTISIFKQSKAGLNSEFSFSYSGCLTEAKEPSMPYYLLIAGERTDGLMPFPRTLVQSEKQIASASIRTQVTNFL